MHIKSNVGPKGVLKIEKVYPDGHRELHWHEKNVIVLSALQNFLSFLYVSNLPSNPINSLMIGTGGTIDPQGQFPKPTPASLTGLFAPLLSVATTFTTNNAVPSVTFIADVDQSMANGQNITEAGLFTVSGTMFNIKTFPAIPKTSEFAVHWEWTVECA